MNATLGTLGLSIALATLACGPIRKRGANKVTLAVLPAESDTFPNAAKALTESLKNADVAGVDDKHVSDVSLEVVQLSIECVEPTPTCYQAVGRSLEAKRLLFAEIAGIGRKNLKVTVTLFDVEKRTPKRAAKWFASEKAATAGVANLVAEATR